MRTVAMIGISILVLLFAIISFQGRLTGEWNTIALLITPIMGTLAFIGIGILALTRRGR